MFGLQERQKVLIISNQQAAPIDKTELKLLKTRQYPNSIAARAVIRSGKGHKYWSEFDNEIQIEIQEMAKELNEILFSPKLERPIKTLDIPIGGKAYSSKTLPLILDFINITNGFNNKSKLKNDETGYETIRCMKRALKIAKLINSNHPSSLGLHPAIYFYSKSGSHKVAMFYGVTKFVISIMENKRIDRFIKQRCCLEELIWNYDYLIQQINRKYRSAQASYPFISEFLWDCILQLEKEDNLKEVINKLIASKYDYLTLERYDFDEIESSDFSANQKSSVFINDAISSATKCKICNGLIHKNAISIDHVVRRRDGGKGSIDNGQLTHPYCNTGYKN
ncbi:MAG: HNH endonuclease signature motif containing protein [Lachnospiraceae bacterium]|nr:HNH endonuclease signature motif containing protein [Lachnospiraceae bacterium]